MVALCYVRGLMVLSQGLPLLIVGGAAAAVSGLVTPVGARWALRWGVVDRPSARKQHEHPVALLGGVSVLVAFTICSGAAIWLTGGGLTEDSPTDPAYGFLTGCWLGASILAVVGLWDDIRPVGISAKLAAQLISAGALLVFFRPLAGTAGAGAAAVISAAWLVVTTNSFNLIDNMDGSASGVGAVAAAALSVAAGGGVVSMACAALAGALLGFLVFNRHPARVFLGDGGSLPIGFLLGAFGLWVAAAGDHFILIALLILGVPLLDTGLVIVSRLRRGLNPLTTPGRDHLSHRLVALGLTVPAAVAALWALGLGFGLTALALTPPPVISPWVIVVASALLCLGVIVAMERLAPMGLTRPEETDRPRSGEIS